MAWVGLRGDDCLILFRRRLSKVSEARPLSQLSHVVTSRPVNCRWRPQPCGGAFQPYVVTLLQQCSTYEISDTKPLHLLSKTAVGM